MTGGSSGPLGSGPSYEHCTPGEQGRLSFQNCNGYLLQVMITASNSDVTAITNTTASTADS